MHIQATSVALLWLTLQQTFCADLHVSGTVNFLAVSLKAAPLTTNRKYTSSMIWRAKIHPLKISFQLNSIVLEVWIWNYFVCLNIIFPKLFKAKKCSRDGWITVLLVFSINKLSWFERKDEWRETSANTR